MHVLQISKTGITVTQRERLTSGAQLVFPVELHFNSDWDDLVPKAVFTDGSTNVACVIVDGVVNVPAELLTVGKTISIQLTGYDEAGLIILPTIVAPLGTGAVVRGLLTGKNEDEPTADLTAQILMAAQNAQESAHAAEEHAENASASAAEAADEVTKMAGYVNQVGGLAEQIADDAEAVTKNTLAVEKNTAIVTAARDETLQARDEAVAAAEQADADKTQTGQDRISTAADSAAAVSARNRAELAAINAETAANRADQAAEYAGWVEIVPEDGYLVLYKTSNVTSVDFEDNNGILEVVYT